jgi:glyoxylate reductase
MSDRSLTGRLPRVVADGPLDAALTELLHDRAVILPWRVALEGSSDPIEEIYTYGHPQVDASMMTRLPGLRVISNYGVGVDHIDLQEAEARGIAVGNTPGVLESTTADLGFAILLAAARCIAEGDRYARSAEFVRYDPGYLIGREVHGQTLGVVGFGQIGSRVARRALGFEMSVVYHSRRRKPELERELGVRYATLDELLATADFVMLTVPLTDATRGLINAATLARMKRSATLVNLARGPVVDTAALLEALKRGVIASAALDVTDPEPLPRDHELLGLPNVVITPHLGSATIQTRQKMAELSVANLLAGVRGVPLLHSVHAARIPPQG